MNRVYNSFGFCSGLGGGADVVECVCLEGVPIEEKDAPNGDALSGYLRLAGRALPIGDRVLRFRAKVQYDFPTWHGIKARLTGDVVGLIGAHVFVAKSVLRELRELVVFESRALTFERFNRLLRISKLFFEPVNLVASGRLLLLQRESGVLNVDDPVVDGLPCFSELLVIAGCNRRLRQVNCCLKSANCSANSCNVHIAPRVDHICTHAPFVHLSAYALIYRSVCVSK